MKYLCSTTKFMSGGTGRERLVFKKFYQKCFTLLKRSSSFLVSVLFPRKSTFSRRGPAFKSPRRSVKILITTVVSRTEFSLIILLSYICNLHTAEGGDGRDDTHAITKRSLISRN